VRVLGGCEHAGATFKGNIRVGGGGGLEGAMSRSASGQPVAKPPLSYDRQHLSSIAFVDIVFADVIAMHTIGSEVRSCPV
jgi:hypothetical protein